MSFSGSFMVLQYASIPSNLSIPPILILIDTVGFVDVMEALTPRWRTQAHGGAEGTPRLSDAHGVARSLTGVFAPAPDGGAATAAGGSLVCARFCFSSRLRVRRFFRTS